MKNLIFISFLILSLSSFAQRTPVRADPAITSIKILSNEGRPVDVNNLLHPGFYIVKIKFQNKHLTNSIPPGSAYISIGLGMGFELDSTTFDIQSAGYSRYIKYYYRKLPGKQAQISMVIKNKLPANFSGTATFKVQTTGGCSAIVANFLINNGNENYILMDEDPLHNSSALEYCQN